MTFLPLNQGKCTVRTLQRSCFFFTIFLKSFKGLGLGIFNALGLYKLINHKMVKETFFFEKKIDKLIATYKVTFFLLEKFKSSRRI